MKESIMSNFRNLKQPIEEFQGIGISHDFCPKVHEDRRWMIQEAKLEHYNREEAASKNSLPL